MARITVSSSNKQRFSEDVTALLAIKMRRIFKDGLDKLLIIEAKKLQKKFAQSQEFKDLSGRLVGEFGFTPAEVQSLDRALTLLVPGFDKKITDIEVNTSKDNMLAILKWVDFGALKEHPFTQHDLTAGNPDNISVTSTISWAEWLENGVTITGYDFRNVNATTAKFSRSGEGIMRKDNSGVWVFKPTNIFKRTAQEVNINFLKKGFGIVVKKLSDV